MKWVSVYLVLCWSVALFLWHISHLYNILHPHLSFRDPLVSHKALCIWLLTLCLGVWINIGCVDSILASFPLLCISPKGTPAADCIEAIINLSGFHVSHHRALKRLARAIFSLFVTSMWEHIMEAKICTIFPINNNKKMWNAICKASKQTFQARLCGLGELFAECGMKTKRSATESQNSKMLSWQLPIMLT